MALKKGVCKNFENCTLADNNEIQEVDSSEFRCTECGKELHEITDNGHHSAPLIIVAAIILIGGGIWAYFGFIKDHQEKEEESVSLTLNKEEISLYIGESDTLKATVSAQPSDAKVSVSFASDNLNVVSLSNDGIVKSNNQGETNITVIARMESGISDTAQVKVTINKLPIIPPKSNNGGEGGNAGSTTGGNNISKKYGTYNLGWGTYNGPMKKGKPDDGIFGEIEVITEYCIDLKDGRGGTLVVKRGDIIVNPKFKDGKWMLQGELHRTDGTRRVL